MEQFHSHLSDENYQDTSTTATHLRINHPLYLRNNLIFHLSDESDQDTSTTVTHLHIILQFILKKNIASFLTTVWYHTDGCAK